MRLLSSIFLLVIFSFSCSSKKAVTDSNTVETSSNNIKVDYEQLQKDGYVKGLIKDFSANDGCGFLIVLEKDKQIIQPMKILETKFLKNGLSVWVKYRPVRPIQPKCNKGITVSIEAIKIG